MPFELPLDTALLNEKYERDKDKLETFIRFAYSHSCRQQWILNYFGDTHSDPCRTCDSCAQNHSPQAKQTTAPLQKQNSS